MSVVETAVAIVGAGPAGMMLAIELGCRDVPCVLLEEDIAPPGVPKANATSARTMEHYRRRGFSQQVRESALPGDHPQDVAYVTRMLGREIARMKLSSGDAIREGRVGDYGVENWPTPEMPHRGQQLFIEPILLEQVRRYPGVRVMEGVRGDTVRDAGTHAEVDARSVVSGAPVSIRAKYVVGCDAGRSIVRRAMQAGYEGRGNEDREFFGGQMLTVYFRAPSLYRRMEEKGIGRAWQWWISNPERRGVFVAVNGIDTFVTAVQLREGQAPDDVDIPAVLTTLVGEPIAADPDYELITTAKWTAGYMLVAEKFGAGRLFIAGDAAHLFTPTAGMGYNTSVDDAVNLGWKLAAVIGGWAGEGLLASYEAERRPIAVRNTRFARAMADSMGSLSPLADIESGGATGNAARQAFGARCLAHVRTEFNIPGLQLGLRYASAVIAEEDSPPPPDDPNRYLPSGYPGVRAPHVALGAGVSILDRFGRDFTLLCFDNASAADWERAAATLGMPLAVMRLADPDARRLYGAGRVLVRPDHHVAWRGGAGAEPSAVLGRAVAR